MSIPMTMTVAMYAISVPDVFVFENTLCCYDEQNKLDRYEKFLYGAAMFAANAHLLLDPPSLP